MTDLQQAWDRWLVEQWFDDNVRPMLDMTRDFLAQHGLDWSDLDALRRTPVKQWHYRCGVCRFVSAYLPKLSERLWSSSRADLDRIVAWLSASKMTASREPVDGHKKKRERSALIESCKASRAKAVASALGQAQRLRNNGWSTVK